MRRNDLIKFLQLTTEEMFFYIGKLTVSQWEVPLNQHWHTFSSRTLNLSYLLIVEYTIQICIVALQII